MLPIVELVAPYALASADDVLSYADPSVSCTFCMASDVAFRTSIPSQRILQSFGLTLKLVVCVPDAAGANRRAVQRHTERAGNHARDGAEGNGASVDRAARHRHATDGAEVRE